MTPRQAPPPPRVTIGVLELVTIIAYGVAYYSYGVLVDRSRPAPMRVSATTDGQ